MFIFLMEKVVHEGIPVGYGEHFADDLLLVVNRRKLLVQFGVVLLEGGNMIAEVLNKGIIFHFNNKLINLLFKNNTY